MSQSPTRLHHSAAVVRDLGASRKFYEDIVGLPLTATWCESNDQLGDFCHAFFGLEDNSAVALFQFADPARYEAFKRPDSLSAFHHLALSASSDTQAEIRQRADAHGISHTTTNHGYCVSLYMDDPDGHMVEITYDTEEADEFADLIKNRASDELDRWLGGDHNTNNNLRSEEKTS